MTDDGLPAEPSAREYLDTVRAGARPFYYFGTLWDAPRFDPGGGLRPIQKDTPVGDPCFECGEPIAEGDRGEWAALVTEVYVRGWRRGLRWVKDWPWLRRRTGWQQELRPVHAECNLLGLLGHDFNVCSCKDYGGTETRRAAALLLLERVNESRKLSGWGPM